MRISDTWTQESPQPNFQTRRLKNIFRANSISSLAWLAKKNRGDPPLPGFQPTYVIYQICQAQKNSSYLYCLPTLRNVDRDHARSILKHRSRWWWVHHNQWIAWISQQKTRIICCFERPLKISIVDWHWSQWEDQLQWVPRHVHRWSYHVEWKLPPICFQFIWFE